MEVFKVATKEIKCANMEVFKVATKEIKLLIKIVAS